MGTLLELLRHEARRAWAWLAVNTERIPAQSALWQPPGNANSIAATYAHAVIAADVDLNVRFHARPSVLVSEGWDVRLGLQEWFPDQWAGADGVDWPVLLEYGREVRSCVESAVDAVTIEELSREFEMRMFARERLEEPPKLQSMGTWKGIDLYTLHGGGHIWMHGGEIACIRGLQGEQGYQDFRFLAP